MCAIQAQWRSEREMRVEIAVAKTLFVRRDDWTI